MSTNTVPMGNAVYGAPAGFKKRFFKIKDGDNIYRILPPLFSLASEGKWAIYESIHWGYKGTKGARTFRCIQQKNRQKMVVKACPECDLIADRKAQYDTKMEHLIKAQNMSRDAAKEFLAPLGDWLKAHNNDKKWYLNVVNQQNEIGRLPIPHKMYTALQSAIADLLKKKIDPLDPKSGVWLNFKRSGTFNQTVHNVVPVMETFAMTLQDGSTGEFERVKKAPLTEDIISRLAIEAFDLKDMFRTLTLDEVSRLVASGGDADVVDGIFSAPETQNAQNKGKTAGVGTDFVEEDEPSQEEIEGPNIPTTNVVAANDQSAQVAALMAQLEALKAGSNTPTKVAVDPVMHKGPEPTVTAPTGGISKMSNADFLANFGKGNV